jgi:hypothetical protein
MVEDRVAGASMSRWRQKVRRQRYFLDIRNYVGPAALLLKAQSLAVCLFPTIGVSDAGLNALQDHRPSSFVHPLPVPLLAQGDRLAGRSSVSPQVAAARKELSQPWRWEKTRGIWEP